MKTVSITVDVEDWFHAVKLRHLFPIESWSTKKLLVVEPLGFILDTLQQLNIKATFFVLGWIAETHPEIVKDIHSRGHEIASHGMTHVPNNMLSDKELEYEIQGSKTLIEDLINEKIVGYRATSFSISEKVLEKLQFGGYKYDSSFFPIRGNGLYGNVDPQFLKNIESEGFKEFQVALGTFFGKTIPFAGGSYFRVLPKILLKKQIEIYNEDHLIMYFHPGDFDRRWARIDELPQKTRMKCSIGTRGNGRKLLAILNELKKKTYSFETLRDQL